MENARLHAKIDSIAANAKLKARETELKAVLSQVTFEHRQGYELDVSQYGTKNFYLKVVRNVPDSRNGNMTPVNNSRMLSADVSDADFVKELFSAVGQFEAHEFAESFRYKGQHAYFPHEAKEGFALYGQGESLNRQLLDVWRDVQNGTSDWAIMRRYFVRGFVKLPVVSHCIAADRRMTYAVRNAIFRAKQFSESKMRRIKMEWLKLRSRIDMAIKAFQNDPMDMPVSQPVSISFTLNYETGEIKQDDKKSA